MNRLILIGNGFDLAHGLKTGYHHFIGYVWKGIYDSLWETLRLSYYSVVEMQDDFGLLKPHDVCKINQPIYPYDDIHLTVINKDIRDDENIVVITRSYSLEEIINLFINVLRFEYSNEFFGIITQNYQEKKWSDIEADYYRELKKAKAKAKENEAAVEKLNKEFNQIKELLKEYLKEQNKFERNEKTYNLIYSPILPKEIRLSSWDTYFEDIYDRLVNQYDPTERIRKDSQEYKDILGSLKQTLDSIKQRNPAKIKEQIKLNLLKEDAGDFSESKLLLGGLSLPENIMLLSFNYTQTQSVYSAFTAPSENTLPFYKPIGVETCHIHGTLDDKLNPMIFGYGDEEAEDYKEMENSEISGLLNNVKSINYLNASSYRDMERFIESGLYQIYLMGMSCSLADRTMLRKLFQHPNCISIKPFYYEWEDKKTKEEKNNYTEIVQNVSRCFSDKDLLRSTVVNKINCTPLPQPPQ